MFTKAQVSLSRVNGSYFLIVAVGSSAHINAVPITEEKARHLQADGVHLAIHEL